jgi:hypothetical protein
MIHYPKKKKIELDLYDAHNNVVIIQSQGLIPSKIESRGSWLSKVILDPSILH